MFFEAFFHDGLFVYDMDKMEGKVILSFSDCY